MKKHLIVTLSLLAFFSCKKKYTCDCSTLVKMSYNSSTNYSGTFQADKKQYSEKMTKKQAEVACEHQRTAIETDFKNGYQGTDTYRIISGDVVITTCSITP